MTLLQANAIKAFVHHAPRLHSAFVCQPCIGHNAFNVLPIGLS
jgi:hypothetical protein